MDEPILFIAEAKYKRVQNYITRGADGRYMSKPKPWYAWIDVNAMIIGMQTMVIGSLIYKILHK